MSESKTLEDFVELLKECKVDDTCVIMIPATQGYDVYRVPQSVAKVAMKLHELNSTENPFKL